MKSFIFTGRREVKDGHNIIISDYITNIIKDNECKFYVGGARGSDTVALHAINNYLNNNYGKCLPVIVVPATISKQPREAQIVIGESILLGAEIVELELSISNYSYILRNHKMIDLANKDDESELITYWDGIKNGGTWDTINYYQSINRQGKNIRHII